MAKGINISKMVHAEMPIHLYEKLLVMAKEMAIDGDLEVATWLVNEIRVLKRSILEKEFMRLKKTKLVHEDYYGRPCVICGDTSDTIDHIIPITMGGTNDLSNLQPMCKSCNSKKSNT